MNRRFEIIDHTADVGVVVYGANTKELFANAALALFSLITDLESIERTLRIDLQVSSKDKDSLLVDWLNELIYTFDVKRVLLSQFNIEALGHRHLKASCYGEHFDPSKHKIKVGVKAATYHMLKLDRNGDGYRARIIFDI